MALNHIHEGQWKASQEGVLCDRVLAQLDSVKILSNIPALQTRTLQQRQIELLEDAISFHRTSMVSARTDPLAPHCSLECRVVRQQVPLPQARIRAPFGVEDPLKDQTIPRSHLEAKSRGLLVASIHERSLTYNVRLANRVEKQMQQDLTLATTGRPPVLLALKAR